MNFEYFYMKKYDSALSDKPVVIRLISCIASTNQLLHVALQIKMYTYTGYWLGKPGLDKNCSVVVAVSIWGLEQPVPAKYCNIFDKCHLSLCQEHKITQNTSKKEKRTAY